MSGLFLTADELAELTGFRSARGQARWLDKNRWRYAVTGSGKPRVTRDYFGSRVGAAAASAGQLGAAQAAELPNFAAISRR
ncbi:MAG TPA: DUF4224 domain-containing protein [Methylibium sp.]|nr:DUF4224 domain-containing protein [Methylibium sp.]